MDLTRSPSRRKDFAFVAAGLAVEADPTNADAQLNLGRFQAERGDLDAAYLSFGQAAQLDPYLAEAYYNLAQIHLRRSQLDLAESNAVHALALGCPDAEGLLKHIRASKPSPPSAPADRK